jgi:hypothetical protein
MESVALEIALDRHKKRSTPAYNGVRRYLFKHYARKAGSTLAHHRLMLRFCQAHSGLSKVGGKLTQADYIQDRWDEFTQYVSNCKLVRDGK